MSRRVLLISQYHPELVRGGAQQICYELFTALQDTEIEPILLASARYDSSPALFKPGAIITGFDGRKDEYLFLSGNYDAEFHRNLEPARLEIFERFIRDIAPNVIHFHHFSHYGLEYLAAARKYLNETGGRLIFTVHEFLAVCLADGQMVRTFNKSPCDRASSVRCHQCFPQKPPEYFSMRKMWFDHHFAMVDTFVATSLFSRQRYVEWGIPPEKMIHIPAGHHRLEQPFAKPTTPSDPRMKRNRFAFFGQLIDSKGLLVLFDAVRALRESGFDDFTLDVFGDNLRFATAEFRNEFEAFFAEEKQIGKFGVQRVRFRGSYEVGEVGRLMENVDWAVFPSKWVETFMMVISEAFAFGKPIICSDIGVMAERVDDNVTGLHFRVGRSDSLAAVMLRAVNEPDLWDRLTVNIKPPPTAEFGARRHIELCY